MAELVITVLLLLGDLGANQRGRGWSLPLLLQPPLSNTRMFSHSNVIFADLPPTKSIPTPLILELGEGEFYKFHFFHFPFYMDTVSRHPLAPPGSRQSFRKFQELFATGARLGLANGDVRGWFRSRGEFVFSAGSLGNAHGAGVMCVCCWLVLLFRAQEANRAVAPFRRGKAQRRTVKEFWAPCRGYIFLLEAFGRLGAAGQGFERVPLEGLGCHQGSFHVLLLLFFVFFSVGSCNVLRLGLGVGWFRGQLQIRTTGLQTTTGYSELVDCRGVPDQLIRLCALGRVNVAP